MRETGVFTYAFLKAEQTRLWLRKGGLMRREAGEGHGREPGRGRTQQITAGAHRYFDNLSMMRFGSGCGYRRNCATTTGWR